MRLHNGRPTNQHMYLQTTALRASADQPCAAHRRESGPSARLRLAVYEDDSRLRAQPRLHALGCKRTSLSDGKTRSLALSSGVRPPGVRGVRGMRAVWDALLVSCDNSGDAKCAWLVFHDAMSESNSLTAGVGNCGIYYSADNGLSERVCQVGAVSKSLRNQSLRG